MRRLCGLCAMLVIGLVVVLDPSAWAVNPVGGGGYNVQAHIDLRGLTRANFDAVVTPAAKAQSNVVFYDFADTLCELLAKEVAEWSRSTGIGVKHVCVDGDVATQQLIAEKQAGKPASADVFFLPNNNVRLMTGAGLVANLPLVDLLPNARDVDAAVARESRGYLHGGTALPFHRNQTSLAFNGQFVPTPPETLDALAGFAKGHSGKVAITTPGRGGSGSGFLESVLLALAPQCRKDLYTYGISNAQAADIAARCMPPVLAYFQKIKPNVTFTNGNEASVQAVANNTAYIATVWEDDLYTLASKGLVPPSVHPFLLKSGQVGDGDGMIILSTTSKLEASLLLANFLMGDKVQIDKLEQTGSRTARVDLKTRGQIPATMAPFLLPDAMYHERTETRINGVVSDAAVKIFVQQILR
ncbi:MAG: extracellular solute-binding protein [Bacillati bacterium ANGP1]|uniref:Extracellular solute-binding protein n=1 Tax=Candidatus Segetimicrobium genomatis TaxID=2569760 RepID=A0A537M1R2_9BACT|nr:MAG: extracellular solute-binding protein [Terrabacteria group bacterium ANGP1]